MNNDFEVCPVGTSVSMETHRRITGELQEQVKLLIVERERERQTAQGAYDRGYRDALSDAARNGLGWVFRRLGGTPPAVPFRRLNDDEIGKLWFSAGIPGLVESAARRLIRSAETIQSEDPQ